MPAIIGKKVNSSDLTADLSQRAYFKGAESISLPWHEIKAGKNAVEDVFKMVLHRYFEEKGGETHRNVCLMFCAYYKTTKQNKQIKTWPMSETPLSRFNSVCIAAS